MKSLIVYFSRKGQNYFNGSIKNLEKGNTERVAEYIAKAVDGELFEVERVKPYPADYYECTAEAKKELSENARPEIKGYLADIGGYDVIFVCYPNWWGTLPTPLFSFLERYDFTGKKVVPVCTNEGSGLGFGERDLKKVCKGATIEKGLSVRGYEAATKEKVVSEFAKKVVL